MKYTKPPKHGYQIGAVKAPAMNDPWFEDEQEALRVAVENSGKEVIGVWDEISQTMWLVYEGEIFKRAN